MTSSATEKKYLARDMDREGVLVARARGSYLYDANRKRYIDFVMGWCVGNLGWNNTATKRRLKQFHGPDYVYPGYSYKGWVELAELLASIAPGALTKCFRATGGSEAVDIALQAAMVHTKRRAFLSLEDAYHGNSLAGLSIGASENRKKYTNLLSNCRKIKPPLDANALDIVETQLKRRDVAAFIMEPISINLGVMVPSLTFMSGLQRLCRRYGTLLVADEVACGFGRTGRLFASEYFDLEPDMMCVAKAITGGGAGLGAVVATADVASSMEEHGTFYSTYGWHPLSVEVAIANIRDIMRNKRRLLANVAEMSDYFRERLAAMEFAEEPTINIRGLAIGLEFESEDYVSKVGQRCRKAGLLVNADEDTILLLPALNIDKVVARRGLDILESCL